MHIFILRRLLQALPVILGSTTIVFILIFWAPGDVVESMVGQRASQESKDKLREELGLDKSKIVQYVQFVGGLIRADFGDSWVTGRDVRESIVSAFKYTLQLALGAILITLLMGISVGLISSIWRGSVWDHLSRFLSLFFISTPIFVSSLILIIIFAIKLSWLPPSGIGYGFNAIWYLILPAIALGSRSAALIARVTRASMLEVLGKIYVLTAYAKGLHKFIVIFKHALKNALIPVITILGLNFGDLLTGAIITEYVFGRPGIGKLTIDAISTRDLPILMGVIVFITVVFIIVNLLVDILYSWIDPRIRYD